MDPQAPSPQQRPTTAQSSHAEYSPDRELVLLADYLSDHAILRLDASGRLVTWSIGAEQLLGYPAAEVIGRPFVQLFAPEEREAAEVALRAANAGGSVRDDWRLLRRDGTLFVADGFITPTRDDSATLCGFLAVVREPLDRRADRTLREREAWHRAISELTSDYAATLRIDADGSLTVEAVTEGFTKVTGYTLQELERQGGWPILVEPEDRAVVEQSLRRVVSGDRHVEEVRIRTKSGELRWVRYLTRPGLDDSGRVTRFYTAAQDITEQKRYEQALEERQRLALFAREVALALSDAETLPGILQRCTDAMVEHLRAALARIWTLGEDGSVLELQASSGLTTHLNGPHGRVPVGRYKIGRIAQERTPHLTNQVIGDPNVPDQEWAAREGIVAFAGYPLLIDGRLVGVMGLFARERLSEATLDAMASVGGSLAVGIERKKAEADARQHREWLRTTLSSIGDGVIATDAQGQVVFLNEVAERLTGWSTADALGRRIADVFPLVNEQTRVPVDSPVNKVLRDGAIVGLANHTILLARDGTERPIDDSAAPIRDARGQLLGVVLVFRDVTERRRTESTLEFQRSLLECQSEAAPDGILVVSEEGRILSYNRRFVEMWDIPDEVVASRSDEAAILSVFDKLIDPEQFKARIEYLYRHPDEQSRDEIRLKDGRTFDRRSRPVRSAEGTSYGRVWFFRDVTDEKRGERERSELVRQLESERGRLEAVLRQLPAGVIIAEAPSGRLVLANDQVQRILHHEFVPSADIEQYARYQGFHRDGRPYLPEEWPLARSIRKGEVIVGEDIVYRRGDGAEIVLLVNSAPVRDREGRIVAGVVIFYEVTAERKAEEELFQREQEFKALAENAPDIIARFDRGFRHLYVNPAVARASGISTDAFIGKTNRELGMPEELCLEWERVYRRVFDTGRETTVEFTYPAPDGPRHYQTRLVPEFARDGSVATLLGVTRDITDRKRLESELREHIERLADADRRKDEFLAMLAHELRNPLAPVFTGLHILKRPHLEESVRERVRDMLERQVVNLTRLVDDLLDVSRITRGKIQLRKERTDLALVIRRAVEATRTLIDDRGHQLRVSLPADPIELDADPMRLEQVLTNLLNNAAKYSERSGRVEISCERGGAEVALRVRDAGIGIPAEMLPRIFDLFVQADHTHDRAHGGLGIGLTLVRSLVEMHGGSVEARSDGPGAGSEFIVRLPLTPVGAAEPERAEAPRERSEPTRRRILVVDDNTDAAESLALMLKMMGHEVVVTHDGTSALSTAEGYEPEVVFLDIGLPGMSGLEIAQRLRGNTTGPRSILVALTGWGQEDDRRRSREAGFDHHLVKPVEPETLERVIGSGGAGDRRRKTEDRG